MYVTVILSGKWISHILTTVDPPSNPCSILPLTTYYAMCYDNRSIRYYPPGLFIVAYPLLGQDSAYEETTIAMWRTSLGS